MLNSVYKIPFGAVAPLSTKNAVKYHNFFNKFYTTNQLYVCLNTFYFEKFNFYISCSAQSNDKTINKFNNYKPMYFSKLKYKGKGFKLVFKKKKKFFFCIFGHSHIYLVKTQQLLVKKTKKYKFFFTTPSSGIFFGALNIFKKIKPINRYTLRGVRTYKHIWIKRKGRKSIATHV